MAATRAALAVQEFPFVHCTRTAMIDGFSIATGYELAKIAKREGFFQHIFDAFIKKHNVLILGSTGVGKSQFIRSLNDVISTPLSQTERTEFVTLKRIDIDGSILSKKSIL